MSSSEVSVVLARGAWADGSSWTKIIGPLAADGVVVSSPHSPRWGETGADVFFRMEPDPQAPKLAPNNHGLIYLPDAAFAAAFAQNPTAEDLAVLAAVQRPISPACITVPVPRPLWKDRPDLVPGG